MIWSQTVLHCPYCKAEIVIKELKHPGLFKDYRECPECSGKFTPDKSTKKLQKICLMIAMASLFLTILLYYDGIFWLIPSLISYLLLAWIIYKGNRKIYLVPHNE